MKNVSKEFCLKNGLIALLCLVSCSLFVLRAEAHPPSSIDLKYDSALKVLTIEIAHVSKNPRKHRIRRVLIKNNNEEIKDLVLVTQTTSQGVSLEESIDAKVGDIISVTVYCSEAGLKTESLEVPEELPEDTSAQ